MIIYGVMFLFPIRTFLTKGMCIVDILKEIDVSCRNLYHLKLLLWQVASDVNLPFAEIANINGLSFERNTGFWQLKSYNSFISVK